MISTDTRSPESSLGTWPIRVRPSVICMKFCAARSSAMADGVSGSPPPSAALEARPDSIRHAK